MVLYKKMFALVIACMLSLALVSCKNEGPAEKAGKKIDQSIDAAGEKAEEAAEAVSDAVEKAGEEVEKKTNGPAN